MEAAFPERAGPFVVEGAGHFLQWERADVLNGALRWLAAGRMRPQVLDQRGVAAAFQVAATRVALGCAAPAASGVEASVTSAASGWPAARPRRTRLPSSVIEITSASSRFWRRAVRGASPGGSIAISQGKTLTATGPAPAVRARHRAAAVERHAREAVGARPGACR